MPRGRAVRPLGGRAVLGAAAVIVTTAAGLALTVTSASADQAALGLVSDTTTGEERLSDARWRGATPDGTHVFFSTWDRLVAADDDSSEDVYERFGGAVTLVSAGQINGDGPFTASFGGVSADGSRVWFSTMERLSTDDDDDSDDLYERSGGQTTLVSTGEVDGPEPMGVDFVGASADGRRVFFYTAEPLVDDDTDSATDVYERAEGRTRLITGLAGATGPSDVQGWRVSTDGSRVYFTTYDALVTADEDAERDIYLREGGALTLVTLGPSGGNGPFFTFQTRMTPDGSHLVFETRESLVAADVDTAYDYYLWSPDGQPILVTGGTADVQVGTIAISDDGQHVYFSTREGLVTADTDGLPDVYRYTSTGLQLVTTSGGDAGTDESYIDIRRVSSDGSRVVLETDLSLTDDDTDAAVDVFRAGPSSVVLVSPGPGTSDRFIEGFSQDARRVFYGTRDQALPTDGDQGYDVYEQSSGTTTLVGGGSSDDDVDLRHVSIDGRRVLLQTYERLTTADTNDVLDVYEALLLTPQPLGAPTVTGSPAVGQVLTCTSGSWDGGPESFAFEWRRDGSPIPGATSATYAVAAADAGHALTCTVTAVNDSGQASATSAAVGIPGAVATPSHPAPGSPLPGACANVQTGGVGADELTGTAAGDRLVGRGGDDTMSGRAGDDCLVGGQGKDSLRGRGGDDVLRPGRGNDLVVAGRGADVVWARDGVADLVRCGGGTDKVVADRVDRLVGCEVRT